MAYMQKERVREIGTLFFSKQQQLYHSLSLCAKNEEHETCFQNIYFNDLKINNWFAYAVVNI